MEVHAVRQPHRTRLTRCHLAPLRPLPHPVLHSFLLGTPPTGLHNPPALRRCLRLRHTPPASCPPGATTSDGFSLAPSALGATAASACAISSPASAPLPGPFGAAPSLPAAVRRYASRACASSSLMSHGPATAASCAASPACSPAVGLPTGAAPCIPRVAGGPPPGTTGSGPVGTTAGAPRGTAGSGTGTVRGGDAATVCPGWGTARGGAAAGAPILPASPGGTPRASPCDAPCCWAPRPGAGTGTGTGTGTVC